MALALERPRGYAFVSKLTRVPAVVPLVLIAGLFALLRYSEQFTVLAAVATYVLAYAIVQEAAVARVLTWRPWRIWESAPTEPICFTFWRSASATWCSATTARPPVFWLPLLVSRSPCRRRNSCIAGSSGLEETIGSSC
jgi:hypothetical protein